MKNFGTIAGALVLAGAVVAGTLYYRAKRGAALGGMQPGQNRGPGQGIFSPYNSNVPRPASGNYVPPGGTTAQDVSAWLGIADKGAGILGRLFQSGEEQSATGPLSLADQSAPQGSPASRPDAFFT